MTEAINKKALERFVDSQPIIRMLQLLSDTGRKHFHEDGIWEVCLCAFILKLEPQCKVYRILESLPYNRGQMDEASFLNTMAHLGYFCRKTDCAIKDIDSRLLPAVFIPVSGTPSIILGQNKEGIQQFYDPVSKMISQAPSTIEEGGTVWFFQRYDETRSNLSKFMRKGSGHSWFRALISRFHGTFLQVILAGFMLNIIALATPLFIMLIYDRVIAASAIDILPMLMVGATIAIIFEYALRRVRSIGLSWLAGRLDNIVSNKIFTHLMGLSPDLIENASVTSQIARLKTFEAVRDFFSGSAFLSLLEAPFIIISLIIIAALAGPMVFIPIIAVQCYFLLFFLVRRKIKVAIRLAAKTSSMKQQFAIDTFEKLESIRGAGISDKWHKKYRHLSGREMMGHFYLSWLGMIAETFAHTLTIIAAISTIALGVHMIWAELMTTGALVAIMILVWRVLTPFYSLCTMIPRLEQLRNSITQVNDLIDIETESEMANSHSRLTQINGQIQFKNVTFRYSPKMDNIFANLTFEARSGDIVVITGDNGTGKATILKLIQSLHQPTSGTVRLDGFDIRQLDAPYLRQQIAYVPKIPHYFSGSIIDNLRLAHPTANLDEIEKALILADAKHDIDKMPDGLHSTIGSHGNTQLTASLAMRLSLVRAYLNPAPILLIDELPNTLLSGRAGKNLKDYLIRAKAKRTVFFCTYREDFMAIADKIVWLKGLDTPISGNREEILNALTLAEKAA